MTGATPVSWDCRGREFPASLRMASAGEHVWVAWLRPRWALHPLSSVSRISEDFFCHVLDTLLG